MSKTLTSTIPPLQPLVVVDPSTGCVLPKEEWERSVNSLLSFVMESVKETWDTTRERLVSELQDNKTSVKPAELGRQLGYSILNKLPKQTLAKSRIDRLYRHKLISECSSWVKIEQEKKGVLSFSEKINLGAIDNQMTKISLDHDNLELSLLWKCWDREYLFIYQLPAYLSKRNILKITQPVVRLTRKGNIVFDFAYEEPLKYRQKQHHSAGIDLGRAQPYTLMITNKKGERVAHYVTSKRLQSLNQKRESLIVLKKKLSIKLSRKRKLKVDYTALKNEIKYLRTKITNLGNTLKHELSVEVARKIEKHHVDILHLEDLTWVKGSGRWNHGAQQDMITHNLARKGIRAKKVNPKKNKPNMLSLWFENYS